MEKLRTALVGFGFMGKTHALNVLRSERMVLKALVDSRIDLHASGGNIETGAFNSDLFSDIATYTDLDACLASESLDLVFICVHTAAHYDLAMKALAHGLHVFVEKPFVLDLEQGEALIREAAACNKQLGVAHVVRFMPAYTKLRELYTNCTYGALQFASFTRFSGVPAWGDWQKNQANFGVSGGALFDLNIHDIDYLHYLLGVPTRIQATVLPGKLSNQDYVCANWTYPHLSAYVKVEGGNIFPSPYPFEAGFQVGFERAAIKYTTARATELQVVTADATEVIELEDPQVGYWNESDYFARCIQDGVFPEACSAASSLQSVRLCHRHLPGAE